MIETPQVLDHPVIVEAHTVSGAVHPLAIAAQRVGYKAFGSQPRVGQVATGDAAAGQVQLGTDPHRHNVQLQVQRIAAGVVQRAADIRSPTCVAAGPGRIGGVLGRPVEVIDTAHLGALVQGIHQGLLQGFACQVDDAHPRADAALAQQRGNGRRHRVDQAHFVPGRQFGKLQRIASKHDEAPKAEGDEQFPHREIEAHRGRGQHTLQVVRRIHPGRPMAQRCHVTVADRDTFGPPGRAGRVDDIAKVVPTGTVGQVGLVKVTQPLFASLHQQHVGVGRH